jgi:hypothetical protein
MTKWITGQELRRRWSISAFQLIEYVKSGLQPHNEVSGIIIPVCHSTPSDMTERISWWEEKNGTQEGREVWECCFALMNEVMDIKTRKLFYRTLVETAYYMIHDVERTERQFGLQTQESHQESGNEKDREESEKSSPGHGRQGLGPKEDKKMACFIRNKLSE